MIYFRDYAGPLIKDAISLMQKSAMPRHDLIRQMRTYQDDARKMTSLIASKLANYEKPKLSAIEQATESDVKFVIEAPTLALDQDKWLENVQSQLKYKQSIPLALIQPEKTNNDH